VDVGELAYAMAADSTEEADHFHGCAVDDLHFLVGPVRDEEEALRLVLRKAKPNPVPNRADVLRSMNTSLTNVPSSLKA
jgi:hypothetical protein